MDPRGRWQVGSIYDKNIKQNKFPQGFHCFWLGGIITSIYCNPFLRSFTCALVFFSGSSLWSLQGQHIKNPSLKTFTVKEWGVFWSHHIKPKEHWKFTPLHSNQPTQVFFRDVGTSTNQHVHPTQQPTNPRSYRTSTWSYFPNCCHQLPPRKRKR